MQARPLATGSAPRQGPAHPGVRHLVSTVPVVTISLHCTRTRTRTSFRGKTWQPDQHHALPRQPPAHPKLFQLVLWGGQAAADKQARRSCRQGWRQAGVDEGSVREFLRQAFFREYSRYLSFHFPFTHERSLLEHLRGPALAPGPGLLQGAASQAQSMQGTLCAKTKKRFLLVAMHHL